MAFLCPSRLGRSKHRHEINFNILDRIGEGVDLDPAVKYELGKLNAQNPEALRIVLHDFTACSQDELTVRQGQKVHTLFREGDWMYVVNADKKEGLIPFTTCAKFVSTPTKKSTNSSTSSETVFNEQIKKDRINNNTYNVKLDKSVVVQPSPGTKLNETFTSEYTDDSFWSTDWSNHSHKHHATVNALKAKCESQSNDHYDDNRNLIKTFFESTPYDKLPKFLEIFNALEVDDSGKEADGHSPRYRHPSTDTVESSFMSTTSSEYPDDTYVTLFDFRGCNRDDLDVDRDDMVVVLDKTDPFWYWIRKQDGAEGYVPSNYIGHLSDPKVVSILGERQKKRGNTSSNDVTPHPLDCACEECLSAISPRTDISSATSSTLNSETKKRPPKPPRTKVRIPKESARSNRKESSSRHKQREVETSRQRDHSRQRQHSSSTRDHGSHREHRENNNNEHSQREHSRAKDHVIHSEHQENRNNKHLSNRRSSSKFSSHHLSLEHLPTARDNQGGSPNQRNGVQSPSELPAHSKKRNHRRNRGSNYREYRSHSQRSYTFEESNDYFDAYFYDEPDPSYKPSPADNKTNIVNVAEIIKHRRASLDGNVHRPAETVSNKQRNVWMKNGSFDKGHNIQNLRQYMQTLPSTSIGGDSGGNPDNGVDKSRMKDHKQSDSSENRAKLEGKRLDWSFGYPRKAKSSHNSRTSSTQNLNKHDTHSSNDSINDYSPTQTGRKGQEEAPVCAMTKSVGSQTDLKDVGVNQSDLGDPSDQMFLDLLSATDNLLEVSEKILSSSKTKGKSADFWEDKGGDRRSSSSETDEDVNEKCSHFIMNQVVNTNYGQLTSRSETSCTVASDISETAVMRNFDRTLELLDETYTEEVPDSVGRACAYDENPDVSADQSTVNNHSIDVHNNNTVFSTAKTVQAPGTHPSTHCTNHEDVMDHKQQDTIQETKTSSFSNNNNERSTSESSNFSDVRGVTEFVVQYDYEPEAEMTIPIMKNDILHISLDIQEDDCWYWAFSPRLRTYGYVPKIYVKIPRVTII